MHAWFEMLSAAAFVVTKVREPRSSEQDIRDTPTLAKTRDRPAFLHVLGALAPTA